VKQLKRKRIGTGNISETASATATNMQVGDEAQAVLQNSWQNNYIRIGHVSEAVLSAIVFVSMIADRPMEMAIIVSDPQRQAVGVSRSSTWAQPCTEACSANPCNEAARFKPFCSRCSNARAQASAQPLLPRKGVHVKEVRRDQAHASLRHMAPQASSEQLLGRDCKN
jgi:hypothetical protein